jgi:hypothetical protein
LVRVHVSLPQPDYMLHGKRWGPRLKPGVMVVAGEKMDRLLEKDPLPDKFKWRKGLRHLSGG